MRLIVRSPESCTNCAYAASRTRLVADELGDDYNGYMLVGEAPGRNEDRLGRPFVGESGRVVDHFLELAGLQRSNLYITNVVRCRPSGNGPPNATAVREHRPLLDAAIADAKPHTIITTGAAALAAFAPDKRKLTACHGKAFRRVDGTRIYPMFHPAYAMRQPKVWPILYQDFLHLHNDPVTHTSSYALGTHDSVAAKARECGIIGFDVETTDVKRGGVFYPHEQRIVGYSVAWAAGQAAYVEGPPTGPMADVLHDDAIVKVCHNAKFEYQLLLNHGITLCNFHDTKLMAYLLEHLSSQLKDLSWQLLDIQQLHIEDVLQGRSSCDVTPAEWLHYAAADADVTLQIYHRLDADLTGELRTLYTDMELPLVPLLAIAERHGVVLDGAQLEPVADILRAERTTLADELRCKLGDINLNSGDQKRAVIFGGWGLPVFRRTSKTSKPSLDKAALELLCQSPRVPQERKDTLVKLQRYEQVCDYLSDFVEKLPRMVDGSGLLHTSLNQAGTWEEHGGSTSESPASGRLSSSSPNLMQIPKRDPVLAKSIRRAFVARPGYVLVTGDIAQEEPRLAALASGDETLLRIFMEGGDVYMPIAHQLKQLFTGDPSAVAGRTERDAWGLEYRDTAKNKVYLPVLYGAGPPKLASLHPGLTNAFACAIVEGLRYLYPKLVAYSLAVEKQLAQSGYARTLFGRRRYLPGVWVQRQHAEAVRTAVNMFPQGTSADILKGTLIRLAPQLHDYDAHLLFPVHDEVVLEVAESCLDAVVPIVRTMTAWFTPISLPVEVRVGTNWGDMKEV